MSSVLPARYPLPSIQDLAIRAFGNSGDAFNTRQHDPALARLDDLMECLDIADFAKWAGNVRTALTEPVSPSSSSPPLALLSTLFPHTSKDMRTTSFCLYARYLGAFSLKQLLDFACQFQSLYPRSTAHGRFLVLEDDNAQHGGASLRHLFYIGLTTTGTAETRAHDDLQTAQDKRQAPSFLGWLLQTGKASIRDLLVLIAVKDISPLWSSEELHILEGLVLKICNPYWLANTAGGNRAPRRPFVIASNHAARDGPESADLIHLPLGAWPVPLDIRKVEAIMPSRGRARLLVLTLTATGNAKETAIKTLLQAWLKKLGTSSSRFELMVKSPRLVTVADFQRWVMDDEMDHIALFVPGEDDYAEVLRLAKE
ncbi:hypothetical protein CBOM_04342 [Ceraceosorus bombacis]|uniref:Uncharacterized protein n=1 Tax=Ceraceosorus bombacis TaxID=401625 RepID=A0A0P1BQF4_9BASI|nr:hypothetical protein CBOM_04342 [Ceraceosorus bombacis]